MSNGSEQYTWIDSSIYEWSEEELISWGIYSSTTATAILNQIYNDFDYVYAATTSGLDIISIMDNQKVAYIQFDGGFSTVWGNEKNVYVGTVSEGLKYLKKVNISTSSSGVIDLSDYMEIYNYPFNVSDNSIKYLHGCNNTLAAVTPIGIDVLNNEPGFSYKSSTQKENIEKCFLTSKNELYYIENENFPAVYKLNNTLCDWGFPDTNFIIEDRYLEDGIFMEESIVIRDIYVTVDTSEIYDYNTLFLATSSGAYIYDEGLSVYDIYYTI